MHYFLDTNVLIADIFSLDPLHEFSIDFFMGGGTYYFSENVKKECEKVFDRKLRDYYDFFMQLYFQFKCKAKHYISKEIGFDFVDISIIHKFVNDINVPSKFSKQAMHKAIDHFLNNSYLNNYESIEKVNSTFSEFLHELQVKPKTDKRELFSKLQMVPNHAYCYPHITHEISKKGLLIHSPDDSILLDAHEFSCEHKNYSVFFITGDQDFYKSINCLLDLLCIKKGCYLKNFS